MPVRCEVEDLITAGSLPSEEASEEEIAQAQRLLENIAAPVSDEEAQALAACFGPDDCHGLSWTLLHLIETALGAQNARYSRNVENPWVQLLTARVEAARGSRG
ncbi:hypothetical protein QNO07_19720 [Streptomyces sp. 549]|uniref:hypothetical protein n=1 Tax=Streptomyces sp. 549 TaxID=3049076 RepID=UPI0024C3F1B8|nr:hypothetical protein [Streptomyces sp. 549]MDK1475618.1 hypothetical protein [Streptomyces sp. 549]